MSVRPAWARLHLVYLYQHYSHVTCPAFVIAATELSFATVLDAKVLLVCRGIELHGYTTEEMTSIVTARLSNKTAVSDSALRNAINKVHNKPAAPSY